MPTRRPVFWPPVPPFSTTGIPEMPCARISARASASVASGPMVTGLTTMPDSNFLTWRTSSACPAGDKLRWITPMPPACAMAMASRDSVTVSIAADRIGIDSSMSPAIRVAMSVSPGITSEWPGCNSTSSKVSANAPVAVSMIFAMANPRINANGADPCGPRRLVMSLSGLARAGTTSPRRWEGECIKAHVPIRQPHPVLHRLPFDKFRLAASRWGRLPATAD